MPVEMKSNVILYSLKKEVRLFFHTSRHFLHKDLDESILTDRAQVLHNVPVF